MSHKQSDINQVQKNVTPLIAHNQVPIDSMPQRIIDCLIYEDFLSETQKHEKICLNPTPNLLVQLNSQQPFVDLQLRQRLTSQILPNAYQIQQFSSPQFQVSLSREKQVQTLKSSIQINSQPKFFNLSHKAAKQRERAKQQNNNLESSHKLCLQTIQIQNSANQNSGIPQKDTGSHAKVGSLVKINETMYSQAVLKVIKNTLSELGLKCTLRSFLSESEYNSDIKTEGRQMESNGDFTTQLSYYENIFYDRTEELETKYIRIFESKPVKSLPKSLTYHLSECIDFNQTVSLRRDINLPNAFSVYLKSEDTIKTLTKQSANWQVARWKIVDQSCIGELKDFAVIENSIIIEARTKAILAWDRRSRRVSAVMSIDTNSHPQLPQKTTISQLHMIVDDSAKLRKYHMNCLRWFKYGLQIIQIGVQIQKVTNINTILMEITTNVQFYFPITFGLPFGDQSFILYNESGGEVLSYDLQLNKVAIILKLDDKRQRIVSHLKWKEAHHLLVQTINVQHKSTEFSMLKISSSGLINRKLKFETRCNLLQPYSARGNYYFPLNPYKVAMAVTGPINNQEASLYGFIIGQHALLVDAVSLQVLHVMLPKVSSDQIQFSGESTLCICSVVGISIYECKERPKKDKPIEGSQWIDCNRDIHDWKCL